MSYDPLARQPQPMRGDHPIDSAGDRFKRRILLVILAMAELGTITGWYIMATRGVLGAVLVAVQLATAGVLLVLFLATWRQWLPLRAVEAGCLALSVTAFAVCMVLRMYLPRYGGGIDLQTLYLWFPAMYVFAFTLTNHRTGLWLSLGILLLFIGISVPYFVHDVHAPYANLTMQFHVASGALIAILYFFAKYQHRLRQAQATMQQLAYLSNTDDLTNLANRRSMAMLLDAELVHAAEGRGFAALLFDVDHFKSINDGFGHGAGDAVLVALAERARGVFRASDALGRWGGDEFLAIVRGVGLDDAMRIANALCASVASSPLVAGNRVTVSCGVTVAIAGDHIDRLLQRADAALYAAKRAGRNCAQCAVEWGPSDTANAVPHTAS